MRSVVGQTSNAPFVDDFEWNPTSTNTFKAEKLDKGWRLDVTSTGGIDTIEIIVRRRFSSTGRTTGNQAHAAVVTIKPISNFTFKPNQNGTAYRLPPSDYSVPYVYLNPQKNINSSANYTTSHNMTVKGEYKDYYYVVFSSGEIDRWMFVPKGVAKTSYDGMVERLATILYGSASTTNVDAAKKLISDAEKNINGEKHSFKLPAVCLDGAQERWGHCDAHQYETSMPMGYSDPKKRFPDPFLIRYIVIPKNHSKVTNVEDGVRECSGDVAILHDRETDRYVVGIIAESGPVDGYTESSISAVWDLLGENRGSINGSWIDGLGEKGIRYGTISGQPDRFEVIYLFGTRAKYGAGDFLNTGWDNIAKKFGWSKYNPFPVGHQDKIWNPHCQACAASK